MRQLVIIEPFHSVIDVITNSSTEIFITDKNQNVETIKEFLDELTELTGKLHGVGEIYELDEHNIYEFVRSNSFYLNFGFNASIPDEWNYDSIYFISKGWSKVPYGQRTEEDKAHYQEAYDAFDRDFKAVVEKNMDHLKSEWLGRIIIEGRDDNSIPYSIWEIINDKFNARNIHLG